MEAFTKNATIDWRRIPMRITTFLNRTIGLPGLWVKGVRIVPARGEGDPILVIEIERRFRLLTCPECGTQVRGRFEEKKRWWRHLGIWGHRTYLVSVPKPLTYCHERRSRASRGTTVSVMTVDL